MDNSHRTLPALTGMRGLAALLVVLSHFDGVSLHVPHDRHLGEVGVMIFFSLSGFLMALLYLQKPFSAGSALKYGIARFARIAPAYLFTVIVAYLIFSFVDSHFVYPLTRQNILRHLAFSGNQAIFWSVPPEVQFYGLFVIAWFALDAFVRHGKSRWLVLFAAGCVALIWNRSRFPGTIVGSSLHFFLFGAIAGHVRSRLADRPVGRTALLAVQFVSVLLLTLLVTGVLDFGSLTNQDLYASLTCAVLAAGVVFAYSYETAWSRRTLAHPVLLSCGECSFSIYLLHEPVIYWAEPLVPVMNRHVFTLLTLLAIVFVAWAAYRLIERPGSRLIRGRLERLAIGSQRPLARAA